MSDWEKKFDEKYLRSIPTTTKDVWTFDTEHHESIKSFIRTLLEEKEIVIKILKKVNDKREHAIRELSKSQCADELEEIDLWVRVHLANTKYYPIEFMKEKFSGKIFYQDFKLKIDNLIKKWRG